MKSARLVPPPLLFALLIPVLSASNCKRTPDALADLSGDVQTEELFPSPDEALQVAAMTPSHVKPNEETDVRIYGAGFEEGARLKLGDGPMSLARYVDENTLEWTVSGLAEGYYDLTVIAPDAREATLRRALSVSAPSEDDCRHVRVFFELDKAGLTSSAEALLEAKSTCYRAADGRINVEGHADERGTTDYNLALGQRRADSVVLRLVGTGLTPSRLQSLSYGEERPLDAGHGEEAWSQNRRAEIKLSVE
jgi:outer membrane protein OmpA-like peptidoglycan-associated protein